MTVTVTPVRRTVPAAEPFPVPASKSHTHRMLILSALSGALPGEGTIPIRFSGGNQDIAATIACLSAMGAEIRREEDGCTVRPIRREASRDTVTMNARESGTTLRLLLPVLGALGIPARIRREGRLPDRPLAPLDGVLTAHGMTLREDAEDRSVLCVSGKLTPGDYVIDGSISSQFLSGLLMALPLLDAPSTLTVTGEDASVPYVNMTLIALEQFGARIWKTEHRVFRTEPSVYRPAGLPIVAEGDWSSAANLLALGVLAEGITVSGLNLQSAQGDKRICDCLSRMGCRVTADERAGTVTVSPIADGVLLPLHTDAENIPDLVPVLAVLCAAAEGDSVITGCGRLKLKESDRIAAILQLLDVLGTAAEASADGSVLTVHGTGRRPGMGCSAIPRTASSPAECPCDGAQILTVPAVPDHRIVMASALAAWAMHTPIAIPCAEAVGKSFPQFFDLIGKYNGVRR